MKRGTNPKPRTKIPERPDPIGQRIKDLRTTRGMSLQDLAERVGFAPSHIFHVENGDKVPGEELAVEIARALHDDENLYRAWARARSRSDFYTAVASAEVLAQYLHDTGRSSAGQARELQPEAARQPWERPVLRAPSEGRLPTTRVMGFLQASIVPQPARLLVPVIAAGADPGPEPASTRGADVVRLDPRALDPGEPLERPFAYALTRSITSRVQGLLPDRGVAIFTRRVLPVVAHQIYAVRHEGRVLLSRAMWNGRDLLLLPAPGASDFLVLAAAGEPELASLVIGRVAVVRTEP